MFSYQMVPVERAPIQSIQLSPVQSRIYAFSERGERFVSRWARRDPLQSDDPCGTKRGTSGDAERAPAKWRPSRRKGAMAMEAASISSCPRAARRKAGPPLPAGRAARDMGLGGSPCAAWPPVKASAARLEVAAAGEDPIAKRKAAAARGRRPTFREIVADVIDLEQAKSTNAKVRYPVSSCWARPTVARCFTAWWTRSRPAMSSCSRRLERQARNGESFTAASGACSSTPAFGFATASASP